MVSHSGTSSRTPDLRPLNEPRPLDVIVAGPQPIGIMLQRTTHPIARVQDTWIIEDEWWRQPISRRYYRVLLENGTMMTIFHDRIADCWYAQEY